MNRGLPNALQDSKKNSISQIASLGKKCGILRYPILLFLVVFIFLYNFVLYFCRYYKIKERAARAVAVIMCFVLLITSVDVTAYAFSGEKEDESQIVLDSSIEDPNNEEIQFESSVEDIVFSGDVSANDIYQDETDSMIEENRESENANELLVTDLVSLESEFNKSVSVDGVVITVTADAGVFPEGATIEARRVTTNEENAVEEAIDEVRNEEKNVAVSYTFDISIIDKDGNEIEPDTSKGSVKVAFKMAEIANVNLETEVYHIEKTEKGLNAENLAVNTEAGKTDEVAVETDGFSYYTVEFTYRGLQYVLEGDSQITLEEILDYLGIEGEVKDAVFSNPELVDVSKNEDGEWIVTSLQSFTTDEKLIVTIGGVDFDIDFEIVVTDPFYLVSIKSFVAELNQSGQVNKYKLVTNYYENTSTKNRYMCLLFVPEQNRQIVCDTKFRESNSSIVHYRYPGGIPGASVFPNPSGIEQVDYPYKNVNGILSEYKQLSVSSSGMPATGREVSLDINSFYNKESLDPNKSYSVFVMGLADFQMHNTFYNICGKEDATTPMSTLLPLTLTLYKEDPSNLNNYIQITQTNTHFIEGGTISYDSWPVASVAGTGYHFNSTKSSGAGKCTAKSGVGSVSSSNRQAQDVTIYYDLDRLNVSFNLNGGTGSTPSNQSIAYGTKATVPTSIPTKPGYDFVGWSTSNTATSENISSTNITKTTTFYAVWKTHTAHTWNYSVGTGSTANSLYAYCSANNGCDNYGSASDLSKAVKISVDAPTNKVYTGNNNYATISGDSTKWTGTGATWPTISYEYKVSSSGTYASTTDTIKAGWYRANITSAGKTASIEYEITKATRNASASVSSWTYEQSGTVPSPTLSQSLPLPGNPTVTYYYNTTGNTTSGTEWNTITNTSSLAAGNYYVYAVIGGTDNYEAFTTASSAFSVAKADCVVTAPTGKSNLFYTGSEQELLATSGAVTGGTISYSTTQNGSYSTAIPTGKNAGTYSVWYKGVGDNNHNDSTPKEIKVTIAKIPCEVTAPTANDITYTGTSQALVTAGSIVAGAEKIQYCTTKDGTYTDTIPTGTDAGTYSVWYKGIGDSNHEDSTPQEVKVTIAKADCSYTEPVALSIRFTGNAQELVQEGTTSDGTFYYSLNKEDGYSTAVPTATKRDEYTVWYKIAGDSNHNDVEPKSIAVVIEKNFRDTINVSMAGYTYGQEEAVPTPIANPAGEELFETPKITFFYNSTESNEDGTEWKDMDSVSLTAGTYYMYAVVEETDSYFKYTTSAKPFAVLKTDRYTVTPPTGKITYGQTLKEVAFEGGSASIQGEFAWADSVKDIAPEVSDSDSTEYDVVFTPGGDDELNYLPVSVTTTVTVAKKTANPEITNIKVDDAGKVTETVTEDERILAEGTDYEKKVDVKAAETSTDYTITYTFIGNYKGSVIKKVSIPKAQKPGDNIISTAQNDLKTETEYNPEIAPVSYDDAKKIINEEIEKIAKDSSGDQKDKAQAIVEKLNAGEENDVIYDAEISVEMKACDSVPEEEAPIMKYIDANIPLADKENIRYVDISVFLTYTAQISDDDTTKITQIKEQIHDLSELNVSEIIEIEVPAELRIVPSGYERTYYVLRAHRNSDGTIETEIMAETTSTRIKFTSNKFSTYALFYYDSLIPPEPGPAPGGPTPNPEGPVPLGPEPEEPKVLPKGGQVAPKTNDTTNNAGFIGMIIGGLALLFTGRKKK